jgi:hypothetical protein
VTERAVLELRPRGAHRGGDRPGGRSAARRSRQMRVHTAGVPDLTTMSSQLFDPQPGGLTLTAMPAHPRISALSPRQLLVPKQEGTHDAL